VNRIERESQYKNPINAVINEETENKNREFIEEERGRSKSLAPWNIFGSQKNKHEYPLGQQTSPLESKVFITEKRDFSRGTLSIINKEKDVNSLSARESLKLPSSPNEKGSRGGTPRRIINPEKKRKVPSSKILRRPQLTENILNQIRQEMSLAGKLRENSKEKNDPNEDTTSSILNLFFKEEYYSRKVLPVRTMSLADFQLSIENESQKSNVALPKLAIKAKLKRNESVKSVTKITRRENTEESKQTPNQTQKINVTSIADLSNLPAEKEKSHLVLIEKSTADVYKPLARGKKSLGTSENLKSEALVERMKIERSSSVTKSVNLDLEMRRLSETDQYKSLDSVRSKKTKNVTISSKNHIIEDNEEEDQDPILAKIEKNSKTKASKASRDKLREIYENPRPFTLNEQNHFSDLVEGMTIKHVKTKDDFKLINDKEAEILFKFLKSNGESAGARATLLRKMLEKEKLKEGDILFEMEAQLKDLQILKSVEEFKASVQEWSKNHVECGKGCRHLKEFYKQIKFNKKAFERAKINEKASIKIPLKIIEKPNS